MSSTSTALRTETERSQGPQDKLCSQHCNRGREWFEPEHAPVYPICHSTSACRVWATWRGMALRSRRLECLPVACQKPELRDRLARRKARDDGHFWLQRLPLQGAPGSAGARTRRSGGTWHSKEWPWALKDKRGLPHARRKFYSQTQNFLATKVRQRRTELIKSSCIKESL